MRVGWARPGCKPDVELGTDELAFVFDGYRVSSQAEQKSLSIMLTLFCNLFPLCMYCTGPLSEHGESVVWALLARWGCSQLHDQHGGQVHNLYSKWGDSNYHQGL